MSSKHLLELLAHPGPDVTLQVLERWFGPFRPGDGVPANLLADLRLPRPLYDFYLRAGERYGGGQNEFLVPSDPDRIRLRDVEQLQGDKWIFYVENQHVYEWATLLDSDDPPVWYRQPGTATWRQEPAPLSFFLLQAVMLNITLFNDPAGGWADSVSGGELDRLKTSLVELPFSPCMANFGISFFASDDAIMQTSGDGAWIGASSGGAVAALGLDPTRWDLTWPPEGKALGERLDVSIERQGEAPQECEFWIAADGTERRWEPTGEAPTVEPGDLVRLPDGRTISTHWAGRLDAILFHGSTDPVGYHIDAGYRQRPRPQG